MIEPPRIVQIETRRAAVIPLQIPREEIRNVMGPAMQELMQTLAAQGVTPVGPIFSHHFRMDPQTFDFEIGVPVDEPVEPAGRVRSGELPGREVVRTVYQGSYEGLGSAWGELDAWIAGNGYTPAPDLWESYVAGPESDPDPATWKTELNRPLARDA
jgi:effector-binding domain-containing protein